MKLKILPLTSPFNLQERWWKECLEYKEKITPIFNRNGYYLDRETGRTWLEIDGKAWLYYNRRDFEYDLATSDGNNWMEDRCYNALKIVIDSKLANKKQKYIYYIESSRRHLRTVYKMSSLRAYRMRKRINQELVKQRKYKLTLYKQ